jgi:hypothetical protein
MRIVLASALALAVVLPAQSTLAQETDTDVPQTFWFEVAGFRVGSSTNLRLSGTTPGEDVDFERDLNLPSTTTQAYVEAFWRPGRRHQLSLSFTRVKRDGGSLRLEDEIEWGGVVFPVGIEARGTNDSDFISGAYRFSLFKNGRLEIGPAIGIGHIRIDATLTGQVRVGDQLSGERTVEGSTSSITGDVGGFLYWWPGRRWTVRGDLRYIAVGLDDADASVTEGRTALTWYPWRQVGIGVQYSYTRLTYDRGILDTKLGGDYRYDGAQVLVSVAF